MNLKVVFIILKNNTMKLKSILLTWIKELLGKRGFVISKSFLSFESLCRLQTFNVFTDNIGNKFNMLKGYRDMIKPNWQSVLKIDLNKIKVENSDKENSLQKVKRVLKYFEIYNFSFKKNTTVLEIGCYGGAETFAMSNLGAGFIDAIDIPEFGVRENPDKRGNTIEQTNAQSNYLKKLRKATAKLYSDDFSKRIWFSDQDISYLNKENIYDLVISWETFEHIKNPEIAIKNMYEALIPGGICFHEYNPFFSINGGHSLCTLDFPYGHVRLNPSDFENYLRIHRPNELSVALEFYNNNLNRLTISQLTKISKEIGFEVLDLHAFNTINDLCIIDKTIFNQCKNNYPTLTINDLISRTVWILLKKPIH